MDLLSDDVRRDPWPVYARLRAVAPVIAQAGTWLVLDHASVTRAMREHDVFGSEVVPPTGKAPDWLVFTDPPRHDQLRGIIAKAFTPRSVAALEGTIRARVRELLGGAREARALDIVGELATPLPVLVIGEMLGIPPDDRARFERWSDAINGLSYSAVGGAEAHARIAAYRVASDEAAPYVDALVAERRRAPRDDLMTRLVAAGLAGADLFGFFQLLLAAGTETTTNLIANAVLCATEDGAGAPRDVAAFVEEVARYRSPAQIMFRQTRRAAELGGVAIPADAFLLVVVGSANRDPAVFRDPDRFDEARAPNPHVGFGTGIHACLGAALARLEARVALEELFALGVPALASAAPWTPRRALHVHGPTALPVVLR